VRRIAIAGLVALAAVLGGAAVPATVMAQPTTAQVRPTAAMTLPAAASRLATAMRAATRTVPGALAAGVDNAMSGEPLISCVLGTDCLGVEGSSSLSGDGSTPTRVARWNGSAWKGVGVALPKGTKSVDLNGVSCKGAKSCLVVGDYYTSTSQSAATHALTLFYNGTSLKALPAVPLPKGTTNASFSSVSCATTRYCAALGVAEGNTAAFGETGSLNVLESWNGAKWTLHTIATTVGKATFLEPIDVSCATSAFCVLAGESVPIITSSSGSSSAVPELYFASWNGKQLRAMKPVTVGSSTDFVLPSGVSCATTSNCAVSGTVLGGVTSGSGTPTFTAFTEIWNGKTWQLGKVTWPKGTVDSFTMGVSCYGAHSCSAVGFDDASAAETAPADAAAVSFNGAAGTLQAVPAPSTGHSTTFANVSCLPWGSCVATGETGKTTGTSFALMTGVWNGKAWKLAPGF
jgi:hypothetical protein